ncbi:MAG: PBP1A family penicillin-binding protein [Actinobacteria bacterium]|nr:PBP1A family penicillin-binding protein [Actinomycetota bacterium]
MQDEKIKKRSKARGCLLAFLSLTAAFIVFTVLIALIGGFIILRSVPSLDELTPSDIAETSKVYALDGSLITEFHAEENREIVPFNSMSDYIKEAVLAVEDKRFYDHQGVDYRRIIGALIADIRSGTKEQGASTITMQYIKNVYFSPEKTLRRKINEAVIAIQLERNYTKDKILELYLNTIYFGAGTYGVEKASQVYFGISAEELDLPQAALLAALIRAPEIYNPFNNSEKAQSRRNLVLQLMHEQNLIDREEYLNAISEPVILTEKTVFSVNPAEDYVAPFFIDYVKQQLYEKKFTDYDVFKGGLRIYTTLDKELQTKAEQAFKTVFPQQPEPSYSLISTDPLNGYIYALVGGKDYSSSKFNIATQGKRQPGSVFKVPVLMQSINMNMSPNDKYNPNGPITLDMPAGPDWQVENYGGKNYDTNEMTVVDATINSVNVVYAQLIMKIGAENVEQLCKNMGIEDTGSNPAIALGGLEEGITPLDVSKIFSTLAANGYYREPVCILKITDSGGKILYEYDPDENPGNKQIMEAPAAYYATKILERVILEGTGRGANIGRPAAGKTGTTSDFRDAWFGGYTPELATVVWIGHAESNIPMEPIEGRSLTGGSYPADIWREFMSAALKDKPVTEFSSPGGELVDVQVCLDSGLLPTLWCPEENLGYMMFIKGKEPAEFCDVHNKIALPDVTGLPLDDVKKIFTDLHFEISEIFEFNEVYNEDIIFKTDPVAGTVVESIDNQKPRINIFVSKGLESFQMPDLRGLNLETALKELESVSIDSSSVEIEYEFNDTQPVDRIFDQDPPPEKSVNKNTEVKIHISKGINPESIIPDVGGLTEEDAIKKLQNAGYLNITVIKEESDKEINRVFSQIPDAGTTYLKELEIVIKISLGIEVPDLYGMMKEEALNLLEGLGFEASIKPEDAAEGTVKSQSPDAFTYLEYGSKVEIELEMEPDTSESIESEI